MKNIGCNTKYLLFDTKEQRNKFILMYKDLFVPYSNTGGFRYERNKNNECISKQLLEGYQLDPGDMIQFVDPNKYCLAIKISKEDFTKICSGLMLIKHKFFGWSSKSKTYWSLD